MRNFRNKSFLLFFWGGAQIPLNKITTWQSTVYNP